MGRIIPLTLLAMMAGVLPGAGSPAMVEAPAADAGVTPAPAGDTVVVTMDNRLRFLPDTVRVRAGQAVRWENTSDIAHTVTADPSLVGEPGNVRLPSGAAFFDSGDMEPGDRYVHVFELPGSYQYVCLPHEMAGMVGVVIVEGGK